MYDFIQAIIVDIPEDNEEDSKTFDMGFLHTLLGTSEIKHLTVAINIYFKLFPRCFFHRRRSLGNFCQRFWDVSDLSSLDNGLYFP